LLDIRYCSCTQHSFVRTPTRPGTPLVSP